MSSFLAKRILLIASYFSSSSPLHYHHRHQLALLTPLSLLRRSLSSESQQQPKEKEKELPFIAQYLISSFGFCPHRALKYSAGSNLAAIKSSERPESVVRFLKDTGLSDDQIKSVVSFFPRLLASNVETTLKPKVRELTDGGFSGELLVHLIRYNPSALLLKDTLSRLLFWRDFVGNKDNVLLKMINKNGLLIAYDIDKHVVPRINLFKEYGMSNGYIVGLLAMGCRCMSRSLDSFKQILEFIEEMGIPRDSGMFLVSFKLLHAFNKETIERKVEFFKLTYGWSQEEVYTAFRKFPSIVAMSEEKVKSNMNFLIRKGKLEPRSIATRPILLGYSLEKRLVPRQLVLSILGSKGLKKNVTLFTACFFTEKIFFEKYIEPYKKDVPELAEAYSAACGGSIPV